MTDKKIIKVERVEILIGGRTIDAYSAGEPDPVREGAFINYLSGEGMSSVIGLARNTTVQNRMSKELKALLGEGLTTLHKGRFTMKSGGVSTLTMWPVNMVVDYFGYHADQGNKVALALVTSLAKTSLDIIINDAFKRDYLEGQAEKWTASRFESKQLFWVLTDSIQAYIQEHRDELSDNAIKFMYPNCMNAINKGLFGYTAKQIRELEGIKSGTLTRDHFGSSALSQMVQVQKIAAKFVNEGKGSPLDCIKNVVSSEYIVPCGYKE